MTKPVVLLHIANPAPYRAALTEAGLAGAVEVHEAAPAEPAPTSLLERAEILVAMSPPAGMLAHMPRLKWIQSLTAGVDHWLPRPDLKATHLLTAARGTHRVQMPENILGALFHITKPYAAVVEDQRQAKWSRRVSRTLAGTTLGILGLGAIGQELARKAAALEMRVIGTKRSPEPLAHVDRVYGPDDADKVLAQSDFVLLLMPVTAETRDFIDSKRLSRMKKDAWLLNFGRGALIVDDDLVAAVTAGTIAGAVLDVFRTEHIGGLHPTRDRIVGDLLARNIRHYLSGKPLEELVDRGRGY
jgi:phosphoglycerate dehydrogenase-like enzyme